MGITNLTKPSFPTYEVNAIRQNEQFSDTWSLL